MQRRQFLGLLAAAIGLRFTPSNAEASPRFGPVTVARDHALRQQGIHLRVIHQGRDVTHRCTFADDTGEGMAELLLHNADGKPFVVPRIGTVAKETVYGVVFKVRDSTA